MRFWDSSALVALVVSDPFSQRAKRWRDEDPDIVAWCLSSTEIWSAVARRRREGLLRSPDMRSARQRLADLASAWHEVDDLSAVRHRALRLLEVHALRAADALQLAAALYAVGDRPDRAALVTVDSRLGTAADAEGFSVVGADLL